MQTATGSSVGGIDVPDDLLYTNEHRWIRVEDDTVLIGITIHAARELGDISYVELPKEKSRFEVGEEIGTIEAVRTTADIHAPLTGRIVEINAQLESKPELLNEDPYGHGWIARIRLSDEAELDDLMSPEDYSLLLEHEGA
jgi:glycine cleavage system H protein